MTYREDSARRNNLMRLPLTEQRTSKFMIEVEEMETLEERLEAVLEGVETMAGVTINRDLTTAGTACSSEPRA